MPLQSSETKLFEAFRSTTLNAEVFTPRNSNAPTLQAQQTPSETERMRGSVIKGMCLLSVESLRAVLQVGSVCNFYYDIKVSL